MSSRYDELDRLQRLRESGALTDDEFQAEKRRVLGHETAPAESQSSVEEVVEVEPERHSRVPLYFLIGAGALIVAILAGLWLGNVVGGRGAGEGGNAVLPQEDLAAEDELIQPQAVPDLRSLPPQEQLARAFETAFGSRGSATVAAPDAGSGSEAVRHTPGRLLWPAFGPVLVSEGRVEDAAHVSAGRIAAYYLRAVGDRFEVVRAFPSAVVTGSFGRIARWSVSPRFSNWPVIVSEGGGTGQGYSCSSATLTELRPEGPFELATIPLSYSDAGAKTDEEAGREINGRIINVAKNQSFDVVYSGSRSFSEHWVRGAGGKYDVAGGGKSQMETC